MKLIALMILPVFICANVFAQIKCLQLDFDIKLSDSSINDRLIVVDKLRDLDLEVEFFNRNNEKIKIPLSPNVFIDYDCDFSNLPTNGDYLLVQFFKVNRTFYDIGTFQCEESSFFVENNSTKERRLGSGEKFITHSKIPARAFNKLARGTYAINVFYVRPYNKYMTLTDDIKNTGTNYFSMQEAEDMVYFYTKKSQ